MAKTIQVDQLANEMTDLIKQYTSDMSSKISMLVDETAEDVLDEVQALAPKRTGKYAQGFKISKKDDYYKTKRIVWNKKDYARVHLLEFGHALWQGGRSPAIPHLRPAYQKYGARLPDDIRKLIKSGG
ncbi:HK97 gp10 family phage protein [Clostridium tyrobutyricum]|uniref:HK97 gp10 family phage protein n=1 Tax=Clostridium tyrobutyricum TaxID=1519 RepID=UPI001C3826FA|nr:HK97 gp10 family phage protein [Clostridium tyrobutyricum]MBV4423676.1 HK97 gp10 family phage protein [Clostridium tyrobutyricum]